MFKPGEVVVCVDAADIPSPPWAALTCGKAYAIRSVDLIPETNGNYDKNIHKRARYCLRLWGVNNPINPEFGKEFSYASSRFEKIQPDIKALDIPESVSCDHGERIAA